MDSFHAHTHWPVWLRRRRVRVRNTFAYARGAVAMEESNSSCVVLDFDQSESLFSASLGDTITNDSDSTPVVLNFNDSASASVCSGSDIVINFDSSVEITSMNPGNPVTSTPKSKRES